MLGGGNFSQLLGFEASVSYKNGQFFSPTRGTQMEDKFSNLQALLHLALIDTIT